MDRAGAVATLCQNSLASPEFARMEGDLAPRLQQPHECFAILQGFDRPANRAAPMRELKAQLVERGLDPASSLFERYMLVQSALDALSRLDEIRVSASVRELFLQEYEFFAQPPDEWVADFEVGHVRFLEMAKIVTFRRFPGGEMHWQPSGFPLSELKHCKLSKLPGFLWFLAFRFKGTRPVWETHLNQRRGNNMILLESEVTLTYLRLAECLELNPEVKGISGGSWLYWKGLREATPHLAWMRDIVVENGGMELDLGEAPVNSGFLSRSRLRQRLYREGKFRPHLARVLWAREDILQWAKRQRNVSWKTTPASSSS